MEPRNPPEQTAARVGRYAAYALLILGLAALCILVALGITAMYQWAF